MSDCYTFSDTKIGQWVWAMLAFCIYYSFLSPFHLLAFIDACYSIRKHDPSFLLAGMLIITLVTLKYSSQKKGRLNYLSGFRKKESLSWQT